MSITPKVAIGTNNIEEPKPLIVPMISDKKARTKKRRVNGQNSA